MEAASEDMPAPELRWEKGLFIRICWITIIGVVLTAVLQLMYGLFDAGRLIAQVLVLLVAATTIVLARTERVQAAASVFAWGATITITYLCIITGGALTPSSFGYFVVIATAAWFLGMKATVALAVAIVIALLGLAMAEPRGWLPEPAPSNHFIRSLTQIVLFGIMVVVAVAISRTMTMRLRDLEHARKNLAGALEEISAQKSQLELVADHVPAMIFYMGPDRRCRWANAEAAQFYAQTRTAMIGMDIRDIVGNEQYRQQIQPQVDRVLAGDKVLYESTRTGPDGDERLLEVELVPDRRAHGEVRGWVGMMRDVTEQRRREQLLPSLAKGTARATGEAFFNLMAAQIGEAFGVAYVMVAETTNQGGWAQSVAFWSRDGALPNVRYRLEGAPCQLVVERGFVHFSEGVADLFPDDKALMERGIEGYWGIGMPASDGITIGLLVVMDTLPLNLLPEQETTLEMFAGRAGAELERQRLDIQLRESNLMLERRVEERTAQLFEANQELEAFSYSVSHDLRTPLRHIAGYAQLLKDEPGLALSQDGSTFVDRILRSVSRLEQLITDLLELSRVGRVDLEKQALNLGVLAEEIADELKHAHPDRSVTWRIQDNLPAEGDPRLLRVVLVNLISNAWKYSSKNAAPCIEVGIEDGAFFVRDNGAGFDMKYAARLFRPFQRLHKPSEFEGTGVGLATVARIVRRHGGRIWAEAALHQGATFRFTLSASVLNQEQA